jgi:hypothetical protein
MMFERTKLYLLLVLCAVPIHAFAGTPLTDTMTSKYFDNCVNGLPKQNTMPQESGKRFCACTAMNMQRAMTQEDIQALSGQDQAARNAINKILIDVNGPCMEYPVHDMIQKECMTKLGNPNICNCLSNKMAIYTKQQTQTILPKLLAQNPNLYDTVTPIVESPEFQQAQQQIALSCATNPNQ